MDFLILWNMQKKKGNLMKKSYKMVNVNYIVFYKEIYINPKMYMEGKKHQENIPFQGLTLTFEPTCPIGQVTVKFYLSESENCLSKVSNMHDKFLANY